MPIVTIALDHSNVRVGMDILETVTTARPVNIVYGLQARCSKWYHGWNAECQRQHANKVLSLMILMLLYTNSFSVFTINSTILSNNQHYLHHLHAFLAPKVGNISQWLLCYRQSSHGHFDLKFHDNCDGKENTVTIVREKEFVFGGYTDIPWGNCNCFIFT